MHPFFRYLDRKLSDLDRKRPWLSAQSGISLSTINSWYANNRPPRLDYAYEIAKVLNVSLDYLMTGEEVKEKIDNPILKDIIDFLKKQDEMNLLRIEGALKMFNYLTLMEQSESKKERGA